MDIVHSVSWTKITQQSRCTNKLAMRVNSLILRFVFVIGDLVFVGCRPKCSENARLGISSNTKSSEDNIAMFLNGTFEGMIDEAVLKF